VLTARGSKTWAARTFEEAQNAIESYRPTYVVSELRVNGRSLFDFLPQIVATVPLRNVVVTTLYPAVATAVRLVRMGIGGYLTKPVCPNIVLGTLLDGYADTPDPVDAQLPWPSLDRTIWEYLCQVYVAAGSMSEAARRLGLNRRSLRRMLSKYPPAH
jgi:two-component system response regulator RegA